MQQTRQFDRAVRRLHPNQKAGLDSALQSILDDPSVGEMKRGDLAGMRVFKFRLGNQLMLLAYEVDDDQLTLMALGSHENFYRDLKR